MARSFDAFAWGTPPQIEHPPLALTYASEEAYSAGIEEHLIEGVSVKVTSIAKTIADCFKYRSKIGLDVALEALKQVLEERRTTRAEIRKYAQICRVANVMRPLFGGALIMSETLKNIPSSLVIFV